MLDGKSSSFNCIICPVKLVHPRRKWKKALISSLLTAVQLSIFFPYKQMQFSFPKRSAKRLLALWYSCSARNDWQLSLGYPLVYCLRKCKQSLQLVVSSTTLFWNALMKDQYWRGSLSNTGMFLEGRTGHRFCSDIILSLHYIYNVIVIVTSQSLRMNMPSFIWCHLNSCL